MMVESHCIGIMFLLSTLVTNSTESFTGAMQAGILFIMTPAEVHILEYLTTKSDMKLWGITKTVI